MNKLLGY